MGRLPDGAGIVFLFVWCLDSVVLPDLYQFKEGQLLIKSPSSINLAYRESGSLLLEAIVRESFR